MLNTELVHTQVHQQGGHSMHVCVLYKDDLLGYAIVRHSPTPHTYIPLGDV